MAEMAQKFEAFLLQSFLETLLTKEDSAFGRGTAGGVWRSMTAEQVGAQLAKHGLIGLDRVFAKHFGLSDQDTTKQTSREAISTDA